MELCDFSRRASLFSFFCPFRCSTASVQIWYKIGSIFASFFLRCAQRKRAKTFTAWISTGCFVNFASRSTWKRFYIEFVFKTGACMVLDRENWSLGVVAKRFFVVRFHATSNHKYILVRMPECISAHTPILVLISIFTSKSFLHLFVTEAYWCIYVHLQPYRHVQVPHQFYTWIRLRLCGLSISWVSVDGDVQALETSICQYVNARKNARVQNGSFCLPARIPSARACTLRW